MACTTIQFQGLLVFMLPSVQALWIAVKSVLQRRLYSSCEEYPMEYSGRRQGRIETLLAPARAGRWSTGQRWYKWYITLLHKACSHKLCILCLVTDYCCATKALMTLSDVALHVRKQQLYVRKLSIFEGIRITALYFLISKGNREVIVFIQWLLEDFCKRVA